VDLPLAVQGGRHIVRLNNAHDAVCETTGLAFVLYDLRHTFVTRMAEIGVDLATLAAILGHSSIRIGQRYVHPTAEHQRSAMARTRCASFRPRTCTSIGGRTGGWIKKFRANFGPTLSANQPIFCNRARSSANEESELSAVDRAQCAEKIGGAGENRTHV
jgi:hypothetical protein